MAGYFILDTKIHDPEIYATYVKAGSPSVAQYGGKYLVRGGRVERVEGSWQPERLIVIEFPTFEQAKKWYNSPEYQAALPDRVRSAISQAIIIEGYSP